MGSEDRYNKERYNPALANCHSLSLAFDGVNLVLLGAGPARAYPAVSGRPNETGTFDYSAARQRERATGPIPSGIYWVRPDELWTNAWYKLAPTSAWGKFRLTIHPFPTTKTHSRGGFFIHGGSTPGSAGCIDLTIYIDRFVQDLRQSIGQKTDCQVHLTVDYSKKQ